MTDDELKQMNDQLWKHLIQYMQWHMELANIITKAEAEHRSPTYDIMNEVMAQIVKEKESGFLAYYCEIQDKILMDSSGEFRKEVMERLGRL